MFATIESPKNFTYNDRRCEGSHKWDGDGDSRELNMAASFRFGNLAIKGIVEKCLFARLMRRYINRPQFTSSVPLRWKSVT
jgi:hypothetical protein